MNLNDVASYLMHRSHACANAASSSTSAAQRFQLIGRSNAFAEAAQYVRAATPRLTLASDSDD